MKRGRGAFVLVILLAAAAVAYAKWPRAAKARTEAPVETVAVAPADFDVTLRVSGTLSAAKTDPVISWVPESQIVWVAPDGVWVKADEAVVRMNATTVTKSMTDLEKADTEADATALTSVEEAKRRLQNAVAALAKAQDDLKLTQLQSAAALEKANAEIAFNEKEVEVAQGQYDKYERLSAKHLLAKAKLETYADEVRAKKFSLDQGKRTLEQAKQDAQINEKVKQLDIDKAQLEVDSAKTNQEQVQADNARAKIARTGKLTEAKRQVEQAEIKAPCAGMLLLEDTWDMGMRKLRIGDRVWEGRKVASVIDPSKMLVLFSISEADITRVKVGQKGNVRVTAIGNRVLPGVVKSVDNLSRESRFWEGGIPGRHVFQVTMELTARDPRLRPGMGGTVEIAVDRAKDSLALPAEAVFEKDGVTLVYRQKGAAFEEVPVQVLRRSEMMASLKGALKSGDKCARRRPPAHAMVGAKEDDR